MFELYCKLVYKHRFNERYMIMPYTSNCNALVLLGFINFDFINYEVVKCKFEEMMISCISMRAKRLHYRRQIFTAISARKFAKYQKQIYHCVSEKKLALKEEIEKI